MPAAVTVRYVKANLSKLIAKVEAGEEVVIMRGKPRSRALRPSTKRN
jgi:antitoxin (DNA-binding transcriptional repressor) of toxin-antitoxin stability system